ncbi:MAG: LysR family transcriptional regulator [Lachnospirales bacterium]
MTILQLKYIITVTKCGSISSAAKELFISQPSLTTAIKELEQELDIQIFNRTNKGIILSRDGEKFLGYARQVVEQVNLIEERYSDKKKVKQDFCISTQHYSFAVEAFVDLIKSYGGDEYDFKLRETQTFEIIEDVTKFKSEVGILYLNSYNETVIKKELRAGDLLFKRLFIAKPHVFVSKDSALASKDIVTLEDLEPYPRLAYEQGEHNSFYFSEEILSTLDRKKNILVRDRATLFNLLIGLGGYTICSGVINEKLNGENIIAIPLDVDEYMEIGYIVHNKMLLSHLGNLYIEKLEKLIDSDDN